MPAVKYSFVGASGSQYLCELFDPDIHVNMSTHGAVIVVADEPTIAPGLRFAYAVPDLAQALQKETLDAVRERYQQVRIWFCERHAESPQTRQRVANDLIEGRFPGAS